MFAPILTLCLLVQLPPAIAPAIRDASPKLAQACPIPDRTRQKQAGRPVLLEPAPETSKPADYVQTDTRDLDVVARTAAEVSQPRQASSGDYEASTPTRNPQGLWQSRVKNFSGTVTLRNGYWCLDPAPCADCPDGACQSGGACSCGKASCPTRPVQAAAAPQPQPQPQPQPGTAQPMFYQYTAPGYFYGGYSSCPGGSCYRR